MRRFVPLVAVVVAGCATSPRMDSQPDPGAPLAAGEFLRYVSLGGYDSSQNVRSGGQCAIYADWVKIDSENGQLWVPRDSLSFIWIKPKQSGAAERTH
jgi:hypothetical protein